MKEQTWKTIEEAITKAKETMKEPSIKVTGEEYMKFYGSAYMLCCYTPHPHSENLYDRCKAVMEECIYTMVLPSLVEKCDTDHCMLRELLRMWSNYRVMVKWLSRFFGYLDRYFVCGRGLPSLNDAGILCFHNLVLNQLYGECRKAVISLIDQERDGKQIDRDLLKNVFNFFKDIEIICSNLGKLPVDFYKNDFELAIFEDTAIYYRRRASQWFLEDSTTEYMLKVEHCLKMEMDRARCYLLFLSQQKLLQIVEHELSTVLARKLQEGLQSEGQTLNYQEIYQELVSKCASLELEDGTLGMDLGMD